MFVSEKRSDAERRGRGRPGPPERGGSAGQRRHRHTVSVQRLGEGAPLAALTACLSALPRLRLARMNEEMKEADGPFGQPGQYAASSPTEQQFRKCIQEFICLAIAEC